MNNLPARVPRLLNGTQVTCEVCGKRPAMKTNGNCQHVCLHCANGLADPFRKVDPPRGRNDPCYCGSGKKFKRCCMPRAQPKPLVVAPQKQGPFVVDPRRPLEVRLTEIEAQEAPLRMTYRNELIRE